MTRLQHEFAEGRLVLPDVRPASVSARAWTVLVRHVRGRVTYTALADELGVAHPTAEQLPPRRPRRCATRTWSTCPA